MTIKARFERFTGQIRPTDAHIQEANRQTSFLIERLQKKVDSAGKFELEKVLKAGSNAKFTSLRRTTENVFDVDLGAYFSGEGATTQQLGALLRFVHSQVRAVYGDTKKDEDFEILKSAVNIKFTSGIKLHVDIAPIIRDDTLQIENGGWIPRKDGWRLTSVTKHIEFIQSRTKASNAVAGPVKFNRLVRLVKWWNNRLGDLRQPSYFCDLVTAAAFDSVGVTAEWQTSLRNVFSFMRRHQFLEPIVFGDTYAPLLVTIPAGPVVVLDSVNPNNNVTKDWTDKTRKDFLLQVQDAYDWMIQAWSCELDGDEEAAVDAWCGVFGEAFRDLSEPEEAE